MRMTDEEALAKIDSLEAEIERKQLLIDALTADLQRERASFYQRVPLSPYGPCAPDVPWWAVPRWGDKFRVDGGTGDSTIGETQDLRDVPTMWGSLHAGPRTPSGSAINISHVTDFARMPACTVTFGKTE